MQALGLGFFLSLAIRLVPVSVQPLLSRCQAMDEGSRQALALQSGLEGQWHGDGLCTGSAYLGFPSHYSGTYK